MIAPGGCRPRVGPPSQKRHALTRGGCTVSLCSGKPAKKCTLGATFLARKTMRVRAIFEHAYSQQSICAPSRMSFMTGRRPDTFGEWNFIDTVPTNTSATPGHFRDHGYITLARCRQKVPSG